MNLIKCYQTNSTWYKEARTGSRPVGILWHDTGAGNPNLKRYVQPLETDENYNQMIEFFGKNNYGNDWNHIYHEAGVHAWIGKLSDGTIATVQAGEFDKQPWGCGSGDKGSCNGYIKVNNTVEYLDQHWIQFEICDDRYKDETYFKQVYKEACEFTAYLCNMFNIDPQGTINYNGIVVPTILCHIDSYNLGLGSNHADVLKWFEKYNITMQNVRDDVQSLLNSCEFEILDAVRLKDTAITYVNGKTIPEWVKNSNLYVRQINGNNITISTVKEGDITGVVFSDMLVKIDEIENIVQDDIAMDRQLLSDKINDLVNYIIELIKKDIK